MARASPMVINSSPPTSAQLPCATTPSNGDRRIHTTAEEVEGLSSSDGLVSPSAFIRPAAAANAVPTLKSGSRAAKLPPGAETGFASTATLWRSKYFGGIEGESHSGSTEKAGECEPPTAAETSRKEPRPVTGKLSRPKAKNRTTQDRVDSFEAHARDVVDQSVRQAVPLIEKSSKQPDALSTDRPGEVDDSQDEDDSVEPQQIDQPSSFLARRLAETKTKKKSPDRNMTKTGLPVPRARRNSTTNPPNTTAGNNVRPAAKKRGKKKRSESIIINSDEPDASEAMGAMADCQSVIDIDQTLAQHSILPERVAEPVASPKINNDDSKRLQQHVKNGATLEQTWPQEVVPALAGAATAEMIAADPSDQPGESPAGPGPAEVASRRRRNWTPVRDTSSKDRAVIGDQDRLCGSATPDVLHPQLSAVLGNYAYAPTHGDSRLQSERLESGESATKRRRIESQQQVSVPRPVFGSPQAKAAKPKRKAKAPKKPQTITALATSAYRQEEPEALDCAEVGFVARAGPNHTSEEACTAAEARPATGQKPKKPRKPRTVKADKTIAGQKNATSTSAKKTKQPKSKSDPKSKEAEPIEELYSPSRASAQLKQQNFLFGTSSQLALEESPGYVREIQAAIAASEMYSVPAPPTSSGAPLSPDGALGSVRNRSAAHVPAAPHGTSLSVAQADRELWCVAARGRDGGLFRHKHPLATAMQSELRAADSAKTSQKVHEPPPAFGVAIQPLLIADQASNTEQAVSEQTEKEQPLMAIDEVSAIKQVEPNESFDLCSSPPPALCTMDEPHCVGPPLPTPVATANNPAGETHNPDAVLEQRVNDHDDDYQPLKSTPRLPRVPDKTAAIDGDDSWFLLSSDPPQAPIPTHCPSSVAPVDVNAFKPRSPGLLRDNHRRSPSRHRSPLQSLDANTSIHARVGFASNHALEQSRALSTSHSMEARKLTPVKRPRGRPRKDSAPSVAAAKVSPKETVTSTASLKSTKTTSRAQRKLKNGKTQKAVDKSEWPDVDEISDSDHPTTPSPPRRRASASPSPVQPLAFQPVAPIEESQSKASHAKSFAQPPKPGDTFWKSVAADLFPRITALVKEASRSRTDISSDELELSWWDKILLYDPIEIEDLTAWLNAQGLRYQSHRPKPKPKKRGRKKKNDEETIADREAKGVEWEVYEDEIKPWMTQKWCEENSICCFFKEHGRRGPIKSRY